MAIYHLSIKTINRSAGRSATAAVAYRAGVRITDERTGELHDYGRKGGIESAELILPADAPDWAADRALLARDFAREIGAGSSAEPGKKAAVAKRLLPAEPTAQAPCPNTKVT